MKLMIKTLQIVMCSNVRPDFNAEEVASVEKDQKELDVIVDDMADHLPIEDPSKGSPSALITKLIPMPTLETEEI